MYVIVRALVHLSVNIIIIQSHHKMSIDIRQIGDDAFSARIEEGVNKTRVKYLLPRHPLPAPSAPSNVGVSKEFLTSLTVDGLHLHQPPQMAQATKANFLASTFGGMYRTLDPLAGFGGNVGFKVTEGTEAFNYCIFPVVFHSTKVGDPQLPSTMVKATGGPYESDQIFVVPYVFVISTSPTPGITGRTTNAYESFSTITDGAGNVRVWLDATYLGKDSKAVLSIENSLRAFLSRNWWNRDDLFCTLSPYLNDAVGKSLMEYRVARYGLGAQKINPASVLQIAGPSMGLAVALCLLGAAPCAATGYISNSGSQLVPSANDRGYNNTIMTANLVEPIGEVNLKCQWAISCSIPLVLPMNQSWYNDDLVDAMARATQAQLSFHPRGSDAGTRDRSRLDRAFRPLNQWDTAASFALSANAMAYPFAMINNFYTMAMMQKGMAFMTHGSYLLPVITASEAYQLSALATGSVKYNQFTDSARHTQLQSAFESDPTAGALAARLTKKAADAAASTATAKVVKRNKKAGGKKAVGLKAKPRAKSQVKRAAKAESLKTTQENVRNMARALGVRIVSPGSGSTTAARPTAKIMGPSFRREVKRGAPRTSTPVERPRRGRIAEGDEGTRDAQRVLTKEEEQEADEKEAADMAAWSAETTAALEGAPPAQSGQAAGLANIPENARQQLLAYLGIGPTAPVFANALPSLATVAYNEMRKGYKAAERGGGGGGQVAGQN